MSIAMRFPDYYPPDEPPAPPPPSLADEAWARIPPAVRDQIERQQRETAAKVARTRATLALHQLALDHQADDVAAHGTMADTGEGWRDQSMARFDARATPLLAALPPELKAEFAPQLANLRDRRSASSDAHQSQRREAWARNAAATLLDAALDRIGSHPDSWPDEHSAFAAHAAVLPLAEPEREQLTLGADGAFRQRAAEAHVAADRDDDARALIRDPDGALHPTAAALIDGMVHRRDAARRQREIAERLAVSKLIHDDVAAVRRGEPGPDIDHDRVAAVFGPEGAERWLAARRDAEAYHANTADFALLPEAEMAARLEALTPAPVIGAEPTEVDLRRMELHQQVGGDFHRAYMLRLADPAAAVREASHLKPLVLAANPAKPETVKALSRATLAAQVVAGLPPEARRVLTKAEAKRLAAPIAHAARDLATRGDVDRVVSAISGSLGEAHRLYGPYAGNVADELHRHLGASRPLVPHALALGSDRTAAPSRQPPQSIQTAETRR